MTAADRPTGPPTPHPDLDTLADLDAGLLDGPIAERLTAHVARCARCTRAVAALGTVRADLAALPAPSLPHPVAARLDATLAGLRHNDAHPSPAVAGTTSAAGPTRTGDPPGPDRLPRAEPAGRRPAADLGAARERRRRRSLRVAGGAVAAAFALIAAAASVAALVRNVGGDDATGGTVAASAGAGAGASAESDSRAAAPNSTASGLPGAAAADALPSYSRDTLRGSLPAIERESAVDVVTGRGQAGPAGAMADPARRQACEQSIIGREGVLRAVRRISYDGRPAYVFVFDDTGTRLAYVVSDACGTGALSPVIDRVS